MNSYKSSETSQAEELKALREEINAVATQVKIQ